MADGAPPIAPWSVPQDNQTAVLELKGALECPEELASDSEGADMNQHPRTIDQEWEDDALWLMQERLARADLLPWPSARCNQDAAVADTKGIKEPSGQQSDDSVSSLSSVSRLMSPSRPESALSSIEMGSDTSSEVSMAHRRRCHSPSASDASEGASDSLELDESVSTVNGAHEDRETPADLEDGDDDACSLPSSISSIISLSSTSPRSRSRTHLAIAVRDRIENIPRPLARECGNADDGEERNYVWFWQVNEYVKPEALSSLSSASDLDLGFDSGDEDSLDGDKAPDTVLVEPSEKWPGVAGLFSCTSPPPLTSAESPTTYDAYVGFDELRNIFHEFFPHRDAMILDVGCGTSSVCRQLVLHGFSSVHGIDISNAAIASQQQEAADLGGFMRFSAMNAAAMTFPASHFEGAFSKAVLDRLASAGHCGRNQSNEEDSELLQVLSEVTRCLRPGGLLISVSCQDSDDLQGAVSSTNTS